MFHMIDLFFGIYLLDTVYIKRESYVAIIQSFQFYIISRVVFRL